MSDETAITVKDVMTPEVHTIDRTATVREAVRMMRDSRISSIIIERREEGDEYGLLAVTDIAAEVIAKGRSPDRVNVYEIMTKPIMALAAEMQVRYAVRLLTRFKLARSLVIDLERKPVGIVTLRDMVLRTIEDE
ncbi:MAG: CBS domain-containing protein [Rhodospirillales bacterium]|jgi:predicted transcriptional regulator|nr:CBS domain-containing protein [Rhodospirillales bacterium]MDP6773170.1 CBS domain-containing protein [Rhodospirillales bacterium]